MIIDATYSIIEIVIAIKNWAKNRKLNLIEPKEATIQKMDDPITITNNQQTPNENEIESMKKISIPLQTKNLSNVAIGITNKLFSKKNKVSLPFPSSKRMNISAKNRISGKNESQEVQNVDLNTNQEQREEAQNNESVICASDRNHLLDTKK